MSENTEYIESPSPESEQKPKRRRRGCCMGCVVIPTILGLYVTVCFGSMIWGLLQNGGQSPIEVSRETTYFTEPVRADGTIDYFTALNRYNSEGVTPENNAAVPLSRVLRPFADSPEFEATYWELLGAEPPGDDGPQFIELGQFVEQLEDRGVTLDEADPKRTILSDKADRPETLEDLLKEQLDQAMVRSWSPDEFPMLAEWLELNDDALTAAEEASQRDEWFVPMVAEGEWPTLYAGSMPVQQGVRSLACALGARAMLRLDAKEPDSAWDDLIATHRLARLMYLKAHSVTGMIASAIEEIAHQGEVYLMAESDMPTSWYQQRIVQLDQLAPGSDISEMYDIVDRSYMLDSILCCALPSSSKEGIPRQMDWNRSLRDVNRWNDRLVEIEREPSIVKRRANREEFFNQTNEYLLKKPSWTSIILAPKNTGTDTVTRQFLSLFLPPACAYARTHDCTKSLHEMTRLSCALAAYRAERGEYSEQLEQLVPDCIAELPSDPFTDGPFLYRRTENGYILHSPGSDGEVTNGDETLGFCHGNVDPIGRSWHDIDDITDCGIIVSHE